MEVRIRHSSPAWLHLVPEQRQSEGHISVRWHKTDCPAKVYFNNIDVSNQCVEALAGPRGWVILVEKPVPMAKELDYRKEHGAVRVAKVVN